MKIFISYSRVDKEGVLELVQAINAHEVWFDDRLNVGQDWWREIETRIADCHCFLAVLSPESLSSEWCMKEFQTAQRLGKAIAPVMWKPVTLPEELSKLHVIDISGGLTRENTVRLLNGLFEIERVVFNPLRPTAQRESAGPRLALSDLYFATTNRSKQAAYNEILGRHLQTIPIELVDIQHVDAGEVAVHKVKQAYEILRKPVLVEQSALSIRALGGLPGGMTTSMILPLGLENLCKMLRPFEDDYAEGIAAIAFTDGAILRKFVGMLPGRIAEAPYPAGYSWNRIFIPQGYDITMAEMSESERLSVTMRRRAILDFMKFLQENYTIV
jgi:non-canonical purine NTP pyrophosphatase (RdgB/HAM1 family)